jgi:hypothetical protein
MSRFFFAWVDPGTAWSSALEDEDEEIVGFEIEHSEGDFATLTIDIRNPRIGFLNASRKRWAWFAVDMDSSGAEPLFFGRLIGVPADMHKEMVRLVFVARPDDFQDQKVALADTLRVAPYWDSIWIAEERRADPDAVLDARSALWHVDRVTHDVTISDILIGEDGDIIPSAVIEGSVEIRPGQPPVRRVEVNAELGWQQTATGRLDISNDIKKAFNEAGGMGSLTGEGLLNDWPVAGTSIGGGWTVHRSKLKRTDGGATVQEFEETTVKNPLSLIGQRPPSDLIGATPSSLVAFPVWKFAPTMILRADGDRSYVEHVSFALEADCQAILTEPGDAEVLRIDIAASDLDQPVDAETSEGCPDPESEETPILDVRRRQYITTDRGHQSLEYLIALARAQLLARARAVEVSFEMPFELGLDLSCRKNAIISDPHLPGEVVGGKVMSYSLAGNGDSGTFFASVTIGCSVGTGNALVESAGTPDYVDSGYVDAPYQTFTGNVIFASDAEDITYEDYSQEPNDDGIDFQNLRSEDCIEDLFVNGGLDEQRAVLRAANVGDQFPDIAAATEGLNAIFTEVCLVMVPIGPGPFITCYPITVSDLMVPKTIDLEADAGSA